VVREHLQHGIVVCGDDADIPVHLAAEDAELVYHEADAVFCGDVLVGLHVRLIYALAVDEPVLAVGVAAVVQDDEGQGVAVVEVVRRVVRHHDDLAHASADDDGVEPGVAAADPYLHLGRALGQGRGVEPAV
jgi:hypothetical protein